MSHSKETPVGRYWDIIAALRAAAGPVVISFAQHSTALRDTIIRNFVARGVACIESLAAVWKAGNYSDCWVLYRALLDRYLHLADIAHNDDFEAFEAYSFVRQFEARNRLMSDEEMRYKRPPSELSFTDEEKLRYKQLKAKGTLWRRPDAKAVARRLDVAFLYSYGYDYASAHVHPMANDGEGAFAKLTGQASECDSDDEIVLSNSILVFTMLMQDGLNASTLRWLALIYNLLDDVRVALGDGDTRRISERMAVLAEAWPQTALCEPRIGDDSREAE